VWLAVRALLTITKKLFDFSQPIAQAHILTKLVGGVMDKFVCDECGTSFNCGAPPGKSRCWCMDLPNLRGSFDLAGNCVCPDCLTLGKAKDIIKMRKMKKQQRNASALRTKT
jgi:hypothetical protein